jgi:hypothetical protein
MNSTWKPTRGVISAFLLFCAAGLLLAGLIGLLGSKTSLTRLALFGAAVTLAIGFCALAFQNWTTTRLSTWWNNRASGLFILLTTVATALVSLAGWLTVWTPLESFGKGYYYVLGVFPLIIWLTCASAGGTFLLFASRVGLNLRSAREYVRNQRSAFSLTAAALIIFGLLTWAAASHVVGMQPAEEDFWYGAGAPVLAFQVQLALLGGIGLGALLKKWTAQIPARSRLADIAIFILIWVIAAWLWAKEPVRSDFLVTTPVAPNFEMYPDYDARNYDIMSQFALLGQGINNYSFFDRTLYPAILVYLHAFAGQDYEKVVAVQAALYAVFPALFYLLGKKLHSRSAGLGLGILVALRGVNQIEVGNLIETAHQKYMLTEYPTALLLALATLLLVKWAGNPSKNWPLAGMAGGLIGLSTLLRPHSLALIPVVIALTVLVYRKKARIWLGISGLVVTAALLGVLPWTQFSGHNISLLELYGVRIWDVIRQRYPQFLQPFGTQLEPGSPRPKANFHLAQIRPTPAPEKSVLAFAADNFLNNLVTSAQVLPNTPFYLEPRVVVKKTDNFWKPYWDGQLTPWAQLLLPLNLLFVALGLGAAWKRARLAGMIPLIVMLIYFAVNALGRTSGGRYLVPVDWAIVIYYTLGLFAVVELVLAFFGQVNAQANPQDEITLGKNPRWWAGALTVLLISAALGALIPLAQKINAPRYQALPDTVLAEQFITLAGKQLGLTPQDLQNFLSNPSAIILQGRSLYPRQLGKDEGLDISVYNFYHTKPYPRTLFTLLGPKGESVIILPRVDPAKVANSGDVMVLGCRADGYVQAWAVVRVEDKSVFERMPPGTLLACPLPDPVCDNNKSCH